MKPLFLSIFDRTRPRLWIALSVAGTLLSGTAWAEILAVVVDKANFREGPSTQSAVLYTADKYFAVEVVEKKDDWIKTRDFEGDVAWIAAHLVEKKSCVVVRVPSALVRENPTKDSPVVFKSDRGEGMMVMRRQGSWLHVVNPDGAKGWVHRDVVWSGADE
ncbi:MAG TPA: SH3 domain-containing protein [Polyangiaceae bacterium]|nr:MAG: Bacterial SH3 domain protein [Deltaproteobacteria bacterium ADurb.Bin207]HNS99251.1 SH3 domain-containing protein [Polyangiaceae bacterium]HNZ24215.1 SH3 domain-containing protein [Polyangiaceae bacterium]HOD22572.1 SH3 domain-containing protein [Polyangiaceae bacterium]HOE49432.1 SH3 domain-containing protein [Polyangiaceae bacterium]